MDAIAVESFYLSYWVICIQNRRGSKAEHLVVAKEVQAARKFYTLFHPVNPL